MFLVSVHTSAPWNFMKVQLVLFSCGGWQQHLPGWWWEVSVAVPHVMILLTATDLASCVTVFCFSLLSKLSETAAKGLCQVSVVLPIPWILSGCHDLGTRSTDQSSDTDWFTSHGEDFETSWYEMPAVQQRHLLCIINFKTTLLFGCLMAWSQKDTVEATVWSGALSQPC